MRRLIYYTNIHTYNRFDRIYQRLDWTCRPLAIFTLYLGLCTVNIKEKRDLSRKESDKGKSKGKSVNSKRCVCVCVC